jgi:membrane-associated progesterone receptor component
MAVSPLVILNFPLPFFFMAGAGGGYNKFAGRDISRALAKMSFAPEDMQNTNVDDLEEKQRKVLDDWIQTFEVKKGYPIVGTLGKE